MSIPRLSIWDENDCRRVHEATLTVLETTGVEVKHERARELLAAAGGRVEGTRVRLGRELVARALETVPRRAKISARGGDGELDLELTVGNSYFGTGSDCLFVLTQTRGSGAASASPTSRAWPPSARGCPTSTSSCRWAFPRTSSRPSTTWPRSWPCSRRRVSRSSWPRATHGRWRLMKEMAAAAGAGDSFGVYSMPTPPLMHDFEGMDKLIRCAELDIPLVYAPAPSVGATAPASVAATAVIGNAEVLSGLVVHQLVKAGAPFVYGCGVGKMNMRTFVDTYNPPEIFVGHQAESDLARWYGLPCFAYAGHSDSKVLDEQWTAEAALSTMLGALSRATLLHDVGYLETGLQSSYETILIGDELIGYARAFMKGLTTDDETLALDEIMAVGPGGDHLARMYTRQHHRDFWQAGLCDQRIYDRWLEDGAKTMKQRAKERVAELRSEPRSFALDDAQIARLDELLAEVAKTR